ncbi:MAG: alkaline phosphatase family protein [Acidobacteriota bacterium]|nr:alkaline phosphatase family protein [Acidobacteriota bacterium]
MWRLKRCGKVLGALGVLWLAIASTCLAGQETAKLEIVHTEHGPNSQEAQAAHYLVLVSLDGFRWDYAKRDAAEHLLALGKEGVWAPEGMLPSFPSLTFPNHLAIVTGLYPEHHGIVTNQFYDPQRKEHYAIRSPKAVTDGTWYSGVPLWSLAEIQGMRAACLFWPGSEAEIAGARPTFYARFNDKVDEKARIHQVIVWLKLPAAERPHFITLYFSNVDHAGHLFGPDAPETRAAIHTVDALVGALKKELDATGLPVDLVVLSDHGMAEVQGNWITLDKFADLKGFETDGGLLYSEKEEDRERVYNQLKKASSDFIVYRRKMVAANLHYNSNAREGDPVVIPTGPYMIRAHGPAAGQTELKLPAGMHGYDPDTMPEMKAIFFAAGPDIKQGVTVGPFENVNLYPWMAHLLGLHPAKNDGSLNVLAGTLRDNGDVRGKED